jgi:hypothetical protein
VECKPEKSFPDAPKLAYSCEPLNDLKFLFKKKKKARPSANR